MREASKNLSAKKVVENLMCADKNGESMDKIKKVFKSIKEKIDLIAIINTGVSDPNFKYLTQFRSGIFEQNFLLVDKHGMELITNNLEYETALGQRLKHMKIKRIDSGKETSSYLRKKIYKKTIGLNYNFLPIAYRNFIKKFKPKKIIDVSPAFVNARAVKDGSEMENIRAANKITKMAFAEIPQYFKAGITEKQLAARFNYLMAEKGADDNAFETIVCFGKNSALPHHSPSKSRLQENSFILIDAGAKYNNYCADLTRTFIFKPDIKSSKYKRMIEIYETVKRAQRLGLESAAEGVNGQKVFEKVLNFINTADHGKYKNKFIHGLGHSIGIEVHDHGASFSNQDIVLKENMVISDEPGIYINGFGGVRIEDDVLIKKKKSEFL